MQYILVLNIRNLQWRRRCMGNSSFYLECSCHIKTNISKSLFFLLNPWTNNVGFFGELDTKSFIVFLELSQQKIVEK